MISTLNWQSTLLSYKCDKNLDVFKGGGEKIIPISIDHQISRKEHFDKLVNLLFKQYNVS